ncbi:MAG: hypothetical protein K6G69_07610 [Lachnospiraceae bacterium]|nr:hypothetical protein [Lachnospiraceae bacterium]
MRKVLKCKYCNKKIMSYDYPVLQVRYGNPIRRCKKCNAEYLDPRYKEMGIEGIKDSDFSKASFTVMTVIGVLILARGIYLFGTEPLGAKELKLVMPLFWTGVGIFMIVGGIFELIRINNGSKQTKYLRMYEESCERLKDEIYVEKLYKLGYDLPAGFLNRPGGGTADDDADIFAGH